VPESSVDVLCSHLASHLSLQITKLKQKKATVAVPGRRLRKLDEANGQIAHNETHFDEQTDNGLMTERTGQVHHGTKQDIVRQWLEGAEQAPPTGAFAHCTLHVLYVLSTRTLHMCVLYELCTRTLCMRVLCVLSTRTLHMRVLYELCTRTMYMRAL